MSDVPPPPEQWNEPAPPDLESEARANLALRPLGITLVVYNSLTVVMNLGSILLWGFLQEFMAEMAKKDPNFKSAAKLYQAPWLAAVNWVQFGLGAVALTGSIFLLRRRSYGLAMTGAIVTMVNPGGACCCLVGTALGVWGLIVLMRPEVQKVFSRP